MKKPYKIYLMLESGIWEIAGEFSNLDEAIEAFKEMEDAGYDINGIKLEVLSEI